MSDKDIGGPVFQENELYVLQMAAISTASFGYWEEGDDIHPDYDTTALRDVAKLYAKYDALYKKQQPAEWVGLTDEEVEQVFPAIATYHAANKTLYRSIARAIEAKLKEKNNG